MVAVGLAEECEADAAAVEPVGGRQEVGFGRHPAENQVRVGALGRQEEAGGLDGRVRGLDRDLSGRKVPPHQDVKVFNLGERRGHGSTRCEE